LSHQTDIKNELIALKNSDQEVGLLVEPEMAPERQQQARKYAGVSRYLTFFELVLTGTLLLILIFSGFSTRFIELFHLPIIPAAVIYFIILVAAYGVISAPIIYYRGFVLPRRYGLSNQSLPGWLGDFIKAGALMLVLGAAIIIAGYWFITILPELWWLLVWGFVVLVSLILSILAPVVIVPIFFKMKPLADTELKERLKQLAKRAGVEIGGIYNIEFSSKSTTANAAMMGMGRTKRIVLSDTLLGRYTVPEIEVVMAHEMGHNRHRDMLRLLFSSRLYCW